MIKILQITKALSDPNRIRALAALQNGELCVCQIIELLGLVASTVSKHMSILRQAGLVRGEKRGKWMYYSLAPTEKRINDIHTWLFENLDNDPVIKQDTKNVKNIKKGKNITCK